MKLNKKYQIIAGSISIIVLSLVAGITFTAKFSRPKISADIKNGLATPILSFLPSYQTVKVNQESEITLSGDFSNQPVTGGTISFTFDPEKVEVRSVATEGLIFGKTILEDIDNSSGTGKLVFLPSVGMDAQGDIAKIKILPKTSGEVNFSFEESGETGSLQPTSLSGPNQSVILPELNNGLINIEN